MKAEEFPGCEKCRAQKSIHWAEESPGAMHKYKVQCGICKKFVKWGTQQQLDQIKDRDDVTLVPFREEPNINRFFSEN